MGNSTKCAHGLAVLTVDIKFSQEFRAVSLSSAGTADKLSGTDFNLYKSRRHHSQQLNLDPTENNNREQL